jgi:phosphoribosylanthranilate isomerase
LEPTAYPRVKICCISSIAEARLAIRYGAAALGLVSEMPSGPGVIAETLIAEIADTVPPGVASVLLTSRQSTAAIVNQQRRLRVNTLQICDQLTDGTHAELRAALPGVSLMQVIHVTGEQSITEAVELVPDVHGLLLDTGNRASAVKELGGTGRRHDWQIPPHQGIGGSPGLSRRRPATGKRRRSHRRRSSLRVGRVQRGSHRRASRRNQARGILSRRRTIAGPAPGAHSATAAVCYHHRVRRAKSSEPVPVLSKFSRWPRWLTLKPRRLSHPDIRSGSPGNMP